MSQEQNPAILVIGAGNGGKGLAADLAVRGYTVRLYNRTFEHIEAMASRGGIEVTLENGKKEFGVLQMVTSEAAEALDGTKLVMVVVPATGHRTIATTCAPYLKANQIIILIPGRTGGALEFQQALKDSGCQADVTIAETETLPFISRSKGPAEVHILRRKNALMLAALPANRTSTVMDILKGIFPQLVSVPNVLYTSLNTMGAIFHPPLVLLNLGRIETEDSEFEFYSEGVTPSIVPVLERLDCERVAVAMALDVQVQSANEWLMKAYATDKNNLYDSLHSSSIYKGVTAPRTAQHRYIFEDVPYSIVPITELGRYLDVDVSCMETMIYLASTIHGTDYRQEGRTLARMGLEGLSLTEIKCLVEKGR